MRGGQVHFSEVLGVDIETAAEGIEIQEMIRLIEEKKEPAFGFWSLCSSTLDWFDQYKVMRILASLISNGYNPKPILRLRNVISEMNTSMPKLIIGSVNDGLNRGRKWHPMFSGETRNGNSEQFCYAFW